MGAELPSGILRVGMPVKRRLDALRDEKMNRIGRVVTIHEIIEDLLAEHDKALEANPL